ncbi:MAG: cell division protein FtsA [Nitrospiraceae bacterium]|nr:cell division protein FtsA [Nitrospiraceae bacterium]
MKGRHIAGLDIGSTKITLAAGRAGRSGIEVAGAVSVASRGLRKGVVVDIDETANSIGLAVKEARSAYGVDIRAAYVGISGGHITSRESSGVAGIKGKEVDPGDLERAMDSASAVYVPLDREILHVLPSEYIIDGQDGISRPLGMAGVRLEVKVQVLTASQAALDNLERALDRSGLRPIETVFQPVAGAMAVLRREEREQGVLYMDMGGGTTDISLFKGGSLRWAGVIPVGGGHATNDIAIGLKLPRDEAERLKRLHGLGPEKVNLFETRENVEARGMNGKAVTVSHAELARIIRLRMEELFDLVKNETDPWSVKYQPLCAVITGGASRMGEIARMAERCLGLPVRIGLPEKVPPQYDLKGQGAFFPGAMRDPAHAAAAGLLLYGFEAEGGVRAVSSNVFSDSIGMARQTIAEQGRALAKKIIGKVRLFEWGARE